MDRLLRTSQTDPVRGYQPSGQVVLADGAVIAITDVEHVSDHLLRLQFSDGFERVIDLGPFLTDSRNPQIREYLQPAKFSNFRLEQGDLVWDDYDLCFSIADLYEGRIE